MTAPLNVTMPDGKVLLIKEVSSCQLVLPTQSVVRVPDDCEWHIEAMAVLPAHRYAPPIGAPRDPFAWGDVQIRAEGNPHAYYRANALTLMDRYWGRYNLNPYLPEVAAKLEHAAHAIQTAPDIPELEWALNRVLEATNQYLKVAAPAFPVPIALRGGQSFTVEHVECDTVDVDHPRLRSPGALQVELLLRIARPVA